MGGYRYPSSRLRLYKFIPLFRNDTTIDTYIFKYPKIINKEILKNNLVFLLKFLSYDIVWIQKRMLPIALLKLFKLFGKKIIYDYDDDIRFNSDGTISINIRQFYLTLQSADRIFVGSPYLRSTIHDYAHKTSIIPTSVDIDKSVKKKKHGQTKQIVIGWIGTKDNLKHLSLVEEALNHISNKYMGSVSLLICSNANYQHPIMKTVNVEWSITQEADVLDLIDIGIMPLSGGEWEKGKAGFKMLLYMSKNIPVIVSGVGVNKIIIDHGVNGFIADSTEEWIKSLSSLLDENELRSKLAQNGYEFVKKSYSTESVFKQIEMHIDSIL